LQQCYESLLSRPSEDELDQLTSLAQALASEISQQPALRREIGVFLDELDAFQIAGELAKGNPAAHGWMLVRIHKEMSQYRTEFESIHRTLDEIKVIVEKMQPGQSREPIFTAPSLPPQGVFGRESDLETLRQSLALDADQAGTQCVAIRGMGGIGKTTLAIKLAHLPEIARHFPEGVLWTTLGPSPSLRLRLNEWGQILGIDLAALPDEEACSRRLRGAIHHRRFLMVVDDVWSSDAGLLFRVGGPDCCTLFTTRELPVANDLVAPNHVHLIRTIDPGAAILLLRALAPEVVNADESSAKQLCRKLEFLPLALTLAGRYLANEALTRRRKNTLVQALLTSAEGRLALPQYEKRLGIENARPSLRAILGLSVDRLNRTDQERFAMLGALGGEPLSWTTEAAAFIWECSESDAEKTIVRFIQRGLVEPFGNRYRMHALLADYAEILMKEWGL
jgi:hypothetical protein